MKLNHIVCTYLNDNGFAAKGCLNANEAYNEMYNSMYQLIISDIMMPEIDGFEFARTVRKITVGNLELDADAMSAEIDGEEISLTTREFNIIYKMLSYPKKTFSRDLLFMLLWWGWWEQLLWQALYFPLRRRHRIFYCVSCLPYRLLLDGYFPFLFSGNFRKGRQRS